MWEEDLLGSGVRTLLSDDGQVQWVGRQHWLGSQDYAGSAGGDLRQHGQEGEVGIHSLLNENYDQETRLH